MRCPLMELGRLEYLQALVTEFQVTDSTGNKRRCSLALSVSSISSHPRPFSFSLAEAKEQVLANLANFAYDPSNYEYLRQLQVLDLFLDMLTEDNETLVEFAMGKGCPEHPPLSPGQGHRVLRSVWSLTRPKCTQGSKNKLTLC